MTPIYLDYNATTPIDPEVAKEMKPYIDDYFGNPSSSHYFGIQTKIAVENSRKQVAYLLNCKPSEIIFTSGGSESNNHAIKGVAFANRSKGNHIITSSIEHPAVIEVCKFLERTGFRVTYLPVNEEGLVSVTDVRNAITSQTILITIMHANNETGSIQPIAEIAKIARYYGIIFHSDAAQSVGKIPTDVNELGISLLSIAGHKLYAPKGIGALYIKEGIFLEKLIHGASHEQNLRAGTENVLEIVGLGKACEIAKRDLEKNMLHLKTMRDLLHNGLKNNILELKLNGHTELRLPNTLNVSFRNVEANTLLSELEGVAASAGAACHSEGVTVSAVIAAMNVPEDYAMGTIRFSTGRFSTESEINKALEVIISTVKKLSNTESAGEITFSDSKDYKLTQFTHGLGCACKIRPQVLERILKDLPIPTDPNILVGTNPSDDAAVYLINKETAIVQTVDFFTPIVNDPYSFGAIAAANSLSDIYAMGAKPLFALNIIAFPEKRLPIEVLKQILKGASDKAIEAGISILGGHTIDDNEPKFGMAVTGIVHPERVLTNSNAKKGDVLILTKPLGIGIITTALKRGLVDKNLEQYIINLMSTLNAKAAEVMNHFPVNACTDVTGFGLLGHLKEMTTAKKIDAEIYLNSIPLISEAYNFAVANVIPGGSLNNLEFVSNFVEWGNGIVHAKKVLLADAQTSGGLLISVPEKYKDEMLKQLHENGVTDATHIGRFTEEGKGIIRVKI